MPPKMMMNRDACASQLYLEKCNHQCFKRKGRGNEGSFNCYIVLNECVNTRIYSVDVLIRLVIILYL